MGVVRDVTIDNLTQAVQGISSTGISDSTGQAINNTLGTLGKDTSLQGIISSINGLGQSLGNDKANISGDNIADKTTFRNNIEVNKVFYSFGSIATDLNDCKAGGVYRTNRSTTNTPTSNYYVVLTLVFNENSDLVQLAIDVNFATLFIRSFHDSTTWTAWKRCDNV